MDVLSEILNVIHLKGTVYFKKDFHAPWGMAVPPSPHAQFHMVVRGHCQIRHNGITGGQTLEAGDCILFLPQQTHSLSDAENSPLIAGAKIVQAQIDKKELFPGNGQSCTLICGHFEYDGNLPHPLLDSMPPYIWVQSANSVKAQELSTLLKLIMQETGGGQPGWQASVKRLAETLFIQMLRYYILRENARRPFLQAIRDPNIYRALQILHDDYTRPWSLESLARQVGISRTALANRFRETVDMTVMAYLAQWRMLCARDLLLKADEPIGDIALRVGYQSEPSFNKAFKKQFNETPGALRRHARG